MMKRILAAVLVVLTLLCAVSCNNKDGKVPEDFMSVSAIGEMFDLYVPKSWQSNKETGVSGGFSSLESGVMANAYSVKGYDDISLEDYVKTTVESYARSLTDFEKLTDPKETTMGSFAALRFDYKAKSGETAMKFRCTVTKNPEGFTVLTCCAPEELFAGNSDLFDDIASYFAFRETPVTADPDFVLVDKDTPKGFWLASHSKLSYRLYVPDTWTVDTASTTPKATFSSSDVSNISMTTFLVQPTITDAKSYWEAFKSNYSFSITETSVNEEAKLGKFKALEVEYTTEVAGMNFYVKQVIMASPDLIYIFTYTSDEANYEKHMEDVNSMISMFEFKK